MARNRGTQAPAVPPKERIDNSAIIAQAGCRIRHNMDKRTTVAWRRTKNGVEVAASFCHNADAFSRKQGTKMAVTRLLNGESMLVSNGEFTPQYLQRFFGVIFNNSSNQAA